MLINLHDKYLFTHIEKTGGSSISRSLQKNHFGKLYYVGNELHTHRTSQREPIELKKLTKIGEYPNLHTRLALMEAYVPSDMFQEMFKFAFVRNPKYRIVALYIQQLKEFIEKHETVEDILNSAPDRFKITVSDEGKYIAPGEYIFDFEFFLKQYCSGSGSFGEIKMLSSYLDGRILADMVGKQENMEEDWKIVCERIGIAPNLPKINVMKGATEELYEKFYTKDTLDYMYESYKEEFEVFGYEL